MSFFIPSGPKIPPSGNFSDLTVDLLKAINTIGGSGGSISYETITAPDSTLDLTKVSVLSPTPPILTSPIITLVNNINSIKTSVTDSKNNVYVIVQGIGNVYNRDGTISSLVLPVLGDTNKFIIKYDCDGRAISFTSCLTSVSPLSNLSVDKDDNIYFSSQTSGSSSLIVYDFSTNSTIGPRTPFTISLSPNTTCMIKWTSSGLADSWSQVDSSQFNQITIAFDSNNNLYFSSFTSNGIVGIYDWTNTSTIGPIIFAGDSTVKCVKYIYDTTTNLYLANKYTSITSTSSVDHRNCSVIDTNDNLYFICKGSSVNIYDFTTGVLGPIIFTTNSGQSIIIIKYVNDVATAWTSINPPFFYIECFGLDNDNNIYVSFDTDISSALPVYDFTITNTLPISNFSLFPNDPNYSFYIIKWLANNPTPIAHSWALVDGDDNEGSDFVFDSKNNLYVGFSSYYANLIPTIYNFSTTSSLGTQTFPLILGLHSYIIKFDSSGICQQQTEITYVDAFYIKTLSVDSDDNLNYLSKMINSSINDFSNNNTPGTTRMLFGNTNGSFVKWLSSGIVDLGTYTTPILFNIPDGETAVVSQKNVMLTTTNYEYKFNLGTYTVTVDAAFGNKGMYLTFLWNGTGWTLL